MDIMDFNAVKVFSATTFDDRLHLGEKITKWIKDHPSCEIVDKEVRQSSDQSFHCITIVLFYKDN
ncbi:MAG: hypothetical protein ABIJ56_24530 [Pseudomonadota bacterium]